MDSTSAAAAPAAPAAARFVNTLDSQFELMNCDVCGSRSTHLACAGLSSPLDDWACKDCLGILKGKLLLLLIEVIDEKIKDLSYRAVVHE